MSSHGFSGSSSYQMEVNVWRSGNGIWVEIGVTKTWGTGYYGGGAQAWEIWIDGTRYAGTWTYDFRGSTPKYIGITTQAKGGLAPGQRGWSAAVNMGSGIGSASASGAIDIPPDVPAAPTMNTPVRISDTSNSISWIRRASGQAPYDSQQVQRQVHAGTWSGWVGVVGDGTRYTDNGTQQNWTDNSTVANRVYVYSVVAYNGSGGARSAESKWVFTTPGAPSTVTAVKEASGAITLTLALTVLHGEYQNVLEFSSDNGTTWNALATLATNVKTYTHASPPVGPGIRYRARTVINSPANIGHGLASAWTQSATVPLQAPPNPPSSLAPNGLAFTAVNAQPFTWSHNTVDSSAQTAYEIQYRVVGASTWTTTGKIASTTQARTFAANTFVNGRQYEWQVRTWGAYVDPSPFSATAVFTTSALPAATITTPGTTLNTSRLTAVWSYFDTEGTAQSAWEAVLYRNGVAVENRSGSGSATSTAFTTPLTDATQYEVRVRVRDGSSLWSPWNAVIFTTAFPLPRTPQVTLNWDVEQGAVQVTMANLAPGSGQVAATYNQIYRSVDGTTWTLVMDNAPLNTTISDPEAPLNQRVYYRVLAWSDLPSTSLAADVFIDVPGTMGYWSAGTAFGVALQLKYGLKNPPSIDMESGLAEKTLHYFAGRTYPVEFAGNSVERVGDVEFLVLTVDEKRQAEVMALLPAPHLFRLPDGTFLYASTDPVKVRRVDRNSYTISLGIQEVSK